MRYDPFGNSIKERQERDDLPERVDSAVQYLAHCNQNTHMRSVLELIRRNEGTKDLIRRLEMELESYRNREFSDRYGMTDQNRSARVITLPAGARRVSVEL